MLFFKETNSYQLVTLIEELEIKRKYMNIFKYLINFKKWKRLINKKIKRNNHLQEKIKLIIDLYKERFYLEQLKHSYNISYISTINYNIINNIIISEIIYDTVIIRIEYGITDEDYSIYILNKNNKGININEKSLNIKENYDICITALKVLNKEISIISLDLLIDSIRKTRRTKNV